MCCMFDCKCCVQQVYGRTSWKLGYSLFSFFSQEEVVESPDVHFEPLVKLPPMEVKTMEEGEEEQFKM